MNLNRVFSPFVRRPSVFNTSSSLPNATRGRHVVGTEGGEGGGGGVGGGGGGGGEEKIIHNVLTGSCRVFERAGSVSAGRDTIRRQRQAHRLHGQIPLHQPRRASRGAARFSDTPPFDPTTTTACGQS